MSVDYKYPAPTVLTASLVTQYTVTATKIAEVYGLSLYNADTVSRSADVHFVPSGGSASAANQVYGDTIPSKGTIFLQSLGVLAAGDFVQSKASAASAISLRLSPLETPASGSLLKVGVPALLTASNATYYTVTSGKKALFAAIILFNSDTVARSLDLYLGTAAAATQVFGDTLQPKETKVLVNVGWLNGTEVLQAKASAASVVSIRPSVHESA